jgi:hypothetical protein
VRLTIKPLKNFNNINSFEYATEWTIMAGNQNRLYFQLVDTDKDELRYMPTNSSYSVSVEFPAIIPTQVTTKAAVQADSLDRSIWYVDILSTDTVFSGSIRLSLTEGGAVKKFSALDVLMVEQVNQGGC